MSMSTSTQEELQEEVHALFDYLKEHGMTISNRSEITDEHRKIMNEKWPLACKAFKWNKKFLGRQLGSKTESKRESKTADLSKDEVPPDTKKSRKADNVKAMNANALEELLDLFAEHTLVSQKIQNILGKSHITCPPHMKISLESAFKQVFGDAPSLKNLPDRYIDDIDLNTPLHSAYHWKQMDGSWSTVALTKTSIIKCFRNKRDNTDPYRGKWFLPLTLKWAHKTNMKTRMLLSLFNNHKFETFYKVDPRNPITLEERDFSEHFKMDTKSGVLECVQNENLEGLNFLLDHYPHIDLPSGEEILELFKIHPSNRDNYLSMLTRLIRAPGFNINGKVKCFHLNTEESPLHVAASYLVKSDLEEEVIQVLLKHPEIDVNFRDYCGDTPLIQSIRSNRPKITRVLLKDPRTDVFAKNDWGETAFHSACEFGNFEFVDMAINIFKVDINKKTDEEISGLDLAIAGKHTKIIQALLSCSSLNLYRNFTSLSNRFTLFGEIIRQVTIEKQFKIELVHQILDHPKFEETKTFENKNDKNASYAALLNDNMEVYSLLESRGIMLKESMMYEMILNIKDADTLRNMLTIFTSSISSTFDINHRYEDIGKDIIEVFIDKKLFDCVKILIEFKCLVKPEHKIRLIDIQSHVKDEHQGQIPQFDDPFASGSEFSDSDSE